jgi:hypothetical protein
MIVHIEPCAVSRVGTEVDIQMPQFELGAVSGYASVYVRTEDGIVVKTDRVLIPPEVYTEWGQDDRFIVDYVMEQLGLVEVGTNIIEPEE